MPPEVERFAFNEWRPVFEDCFDAAGGIGGAGAEDGAGAQMGGEGSGVVVLDGLGEGEFAVPDGAFFGGCFGGSGRTSLRVSACGYRECQDYQRVLDCPMN